MWSTCFPHWQPSSETKPWHHQIATDKVRAASADRWPWLQHEARLRRYETCTLGNHLLSLHPSDCLWEKSSPGTTHLCSPFIRSASAVLGEQGTEPPASSEHLPCLAPPRLCWTHSQGVPAGLWPGWAVLSPLLLARMAQRWWSQQLAVGRAWGDRTAAAQSCLWKCSE